MTEPITITARTRTGDTLYAIVKRGSIPSRGLLAYSKEVAALVPFATVQAALSELAAAAGDVNPPWRGEM